jgi:hypothetical protein
MNMLYVLIWDDHGYSNTVQICNYFLGGTSLKLTTTDAFNYLQPIFSNKQIMPLFLALAEYVLIMSRQQ